MSDLPDLESDLPDLGPCCVCETGKGVTNIGIVNRRCPIPGRGWGCLVCGLPPDGAIVVMCNRCVGLKPRFVCRGYPGEDGRIPHEELSADPFEHDMAKHAND